MNLSYKIWCSLTFLWIGYECFYKDQSGETPFRRIDWESEMKSSEKDSKAQDSYKNISDEELDRQIELMKKKRMN